MKSLTANITPKYECKSSWNSTSAQKPSNPHQLFTELSVSSSIFYLIVPLPLPLAFALTLQLSIGTLENSYSHKTKLMLSGVTMTYSSNNKNNNNKHKACCYCRWLLCPANSCHAIKYKFFILIRFHFFAASAELNWGWATIIIL